MSEPMRDEVELPALNITEEEKRLAKMIMSDIARPFVERLQCRERQLKAALSANRELQIMLEVRTIEIKNAEEENSLLLATNREKDAEIERLNREYSKFHSLHDANPLSGLNGGGLNIIGDEPSMKKVRDALWYYDQRGEFMQEWKNRIEAADAELSSLRASGGEKWIEIKEGCEMPKDDFNVLVWIPTSNKFGGYWDRASYGDYICEDEDCRPGDPNYVEGDDEGNRRGGGWHRQEETHGGPYDYVYVDLNDKVTHWMPLPAPPTLTREKE